ncbi:BglG family transcription antiterminator LicT [Lysinibacillus piscis]|uniref:Transcription antiterminator BglG n=1 Tax=Lysinibacillus piscis TaxID=2518931 RepID=A0ABQ5NGL0_9BACI|nr:PRD domain-containing protein [Lysinibacillus sp. KH24]GLC87202.1 transcription antiterminator BglG [Lysinibacillus sp. KH24]
MEIKKIFNNNVALTENSDGKELVVMGKGLAFSKKIGDSIDESKIEKTFILENQTISDKLTDLLVDVPAKHFELAYKILEYARAKLSYPLDDYIYVALTDHLSFAITRHKKGIILKNALFFEIRKFYKEEFQIAKEALDIIEREIDIRFDEDEAASIALHLVNSQLTDTNIGATMQMTKMVHDILHIVKYHFLVSLDEQSVNYERFVTHLRFFALRLFKKEHNLDNQVEQFLFEQVQQKYDKAFQCSEKIMQYLQQEYQYVMSNDDKMYLTLHIQRVTNRQSLQEH